MNVCAQNLIQSAAVVRKRKQKYSSISQYDNSSYDRMKILTIKTNDVSLTVATEVLQTSCHVFLSFSTFMSKLSRARERSFRSSAVTLIIVFGRCLKDRDFGFDVALIRP